MCGTGTENFKSQAIFSAWLFFAAAVDLDISSEKAFNSRLRSA
jgi:hypothetical protein